MRIARSTLLTAVTMLGLCVQSAWADAFIDFFRHQQIGQEIWVQGPFRRNAQVKHLFKKDGKTGAVEYYTLFATVILPAHLIGNGVLHKAPRSSDVVVVFYPDESAVKDLPVEGNNVWFIGTLFGYQWGRQAITTSIGSGGYPYLLLQQVLPARVEQSPGLSFTPRHIHWQNGE
jgi:hypothetical protein